MAIVIELIDPASEHYRYIGQHRCGHAAPKNTGYGFGYDITVERAQARIDAEDSVCYHCHTARGAAAGTWGTCDEVCRVNGTHPF